MMFRQIDKHAGMAQEPVLARTSTTTKPKLVWYRSGIIFNNHNCCK